MARPMEDAGSCRTVTYREPTTRYCADLCNAPRRNATPVVGYFELLFLALGLTARTMTIIMIASIVMVSHLGLNGRGMRKTISHRSQRGHGSRSLSMSIRITYAALSNPCSEAQLRRRDSRSFWRKQVHYRTARCVV